VRNKKTMPDRRNLARFCWPLILLLGAVVTRAGAGGKLVWKPEAAAQLKVAGHSQKIWNVYRVDKNKDVVLVQIWKRYLLLDIKQRTVYELLPSDLQKQGNNFSSGAPGEQGRLIPSSTWVERDIGPAELVRLKLLDYGQILELQLPHPLDLRAVY
jgi:hypothetical protein